MKKTEEEIISAKKKRAKKKGSKEQGKINMKSIRKFFKKNGEKIALTVFCVAIAAGIIVWAFSLFGKKEEQVAQVRYDYDLSKYIELKQVENIRAPFADPNVCTEEEVDYAIHQIMLGYAEFTPKAADAVAENYDKVVVDYKIYYDGAVMEEFSQPEYGIIIGYDGNGDVDNALAGELEGKKVGDKCRVTYTFPTDDISLGSWAGVTVDCEGLILSIHSSLVPECTDEFVQNLGDYNFENVQQFREQLKIDTMEQKLEAKKSIVLDTFIAGAVVKEYPEAELNMYVERYVSDIKTMADDLGMEYADYVKEYLQTTEDAINDAAWEDAKNRVKNDMACIQATRLLKVTITEEEYQEGLKGYYEQEKDNFASAEEFEAHYTRPFMEDCIRWDKAFEIMVRDAVSSLK